DLYEKVDGTNPYGVLADLAIGRAPRWIRRAGRYGAAASFVFREFDGAIKVAPSRAEIRWLQAAHPGTCLQTFIKHGASRGREMKWLGSYRYATVNIGGRHRRALFPCYASGCAHPAFAPPPRRGLESPPPAVPPR